MRVAVIGAGASGLVASIYAASSDNEVYLLEKNDVCGKKILITGNGRCNYWNSDQSDSHYHTSCLDGVRGIMTEENRKEILTFFERLGIVPRIRDGYYYPYSSQAVSIRNALVKEALVRGVNIVNCALVIDIEKSGKKFRVITSDREYLFDRVIVSTGSYAYPKTGSDGMGYIFARKFGHNIIKPLPALVYVKVESNYLKKWHGIRSLVEVNLIESGKFVASQVGEIQLVNSGVSGICIFCLSGIVSRGLDKGLREQIEINFLHPFGIRNASMFLDWMDKRNSLVCKRNIADLLDGILNYKLVNLVLEICKIDRDDSWDNLSLERRGALGNMLTKFTLDVVGTGEFDMAQTTTGGISLDCIDVKTMESKIVSGLYFTGELLDVDGDCGGYNLSFAWVTGMLAGIGSR